MSKQHSPLLLHTLTKEQLTELAKLSFDLAKGTFALLILQTINSLQPSTEDIIKIILELFWSIAFTYLGLVFLELKRRIKE